jgi:uracil permease
MNDNNLLYGISDTPKTIKEWILYSLQQLMAVFVATVLIATICGTPISSCFLGGAIGTIVYQLITRFKSPMFISNSGATVSAVIGALALSADRQNYLMVFIGGLVIAAIYCAMAMIIKYKGISAINKIFPPTIVGAVTIVIGLNLAGFIPTYIQVGGSYSLWGAFVAIATMIVIAVSSHYFKGFLKTIPFLIGLVFGYVMCLILDLCGVDMINWAAFENIKWYPDLAFLHWRAGDFSWSNLGQTVLLFAPVAICALLEHYSDHKVLSNIIGTDLTAEPGLDKTLVGDGVASAVGTALCGLPNTSYGESIATTGFSRVASVKVVTLAAAIMFLLAFVGPLQAVIQSIPSCVFGGCAMILYGYIACSGLKTIIREKINLEDNKNLIVVSVILTTGVGGMFLQFGSFQMAGVALSMILGVILNLILKSKKDDINA